MTDNIAELRPLRNSIREGVLTREAAEAIRLLIDVVTQELPQTSTDLPRLPEPTKKKAKA